jgi:hypothetical protein
MRNWYQQQEESGDMPYLSDSPLPDSPNLSQSTAGGIASSVERTVAVKILLVLSPELLGGAACSMKHTWYCTYI